MNLNLFIVRRTRYNIMWWSLSVICDRSLVSSGYFGFLHQESWPPWYNWNIVESGVNTINNIFGGARMAQWVRSLDLTSHTSLSPIQRWFALSFVNYKKGCTRLAATSDKVYELLAQGRWFSPGIPASSTTETGCHYIAEILLKVALNTKIHSFIPNFWKGWSWKYGMSITTHCCEFEPCSWWGVLDTTLWLCGKVCLWLATGWWFSPGTLHQ